MLNSPEARTEFFSGLRACAGLLMSIIPFGMVFGAAGIASGMSVGQTFAMSWFIFAGSAQIAATQLLVAGAPLLVVIATGAIVNLRLAMYATSLAPHLRGTSTRFKALVAYLLTDQAYALSLARYIEKPESTQQVHAFYLGIAGGLWLVWQLATLAGIFLGSLVPASWSPDFIIPLTFISLAVPLIKDRAMLAAALTGGLAAVLIDLPMKTNLIAAALLGIIAGRLFEHWSPRHG